MKNPRSVRRIFAVQSGKGTKSDKITNKLVTCAKCLQNMIFDVSGIKSVIAVSTINPLKPSLSNYYTLAYRPTYHF